jgi:hypothetical protein
MFEMVYVLEDHFHILVIYCMDLWEINKYDTIWHFIWSVGLLKDWNRRGWTIDHDSHGARTSQGLPPFIHYGLFEPEETDWLCWSNKLAAEISRPNPAQFIFMGSYEWDGLQDQSTDGSGTLLRIMSAVVYIWEHHEMMQWAVNSCLNQAVYWKLWQTFWTVNLKCVS